MTKDQYLGFIATIPDSEGMEVLDQVEWLHMITAWSAKAEIELGGEEIEILCSREYEFLKAIKEALKGFDPRSAPQRQ